jgi:hypothetical protein
MRLSPWLPTNCVCGYRHGRTTTAATAAPRGCRTDLPRPRSTRSESSRGDGSQWACALVRATAGGTELRAVDWRCSRDPSWPNRAGVWASSRSSLRRLSPIKRTLRACATITSCPNSLSSRLTHGECIPVSRAIRLRGIHPITSFIAFAVVLSLCSSSTSPLRPTCNTNSEHAKKF